MSAYYLAVDIGASSGRHILGHIDEDGKLILKEIYRFSNGMVEKNGHKIWEIERLFREIKTGMKKCAEMKIIPASMGIDTWGVDFILLDKHGNRFSDAVGYRDFRTKGMDEAVYRIIPEEILYEQTGSQKQIYNTIYQLMALKEKEPEILKKADCLLMMPDYFHYLLTGKKAVEYTNATTTQLIEPFTKTWNMNLIKKLGYPEKIFPEIIEPGTVLGDLCEDVQKEVGFNCKVTVPCTHDTASAVAAVPAEPDKQIVYICSGTWSLLGTELKKPLCTPSAHQNNFTNEGGFAYRYRFLKNIMGLWMIQSVQKELAPDKGFSEICREAAKETISSIVDCDDERFLAPENMSEEIRKACGESGQEIPEGIAQTACVVYNSLADCYRKAVKGLEKVTNRKYSRIYIVGGGANADYLNGLTAKYVEKPVWAGPTEATAVGNLLIQMLAQKEFKSFKEARECVIYSSDTTVYWGIRSNKGFPVRNGSDRIQ